MKSNEISRLRFAPLDIRVCRGLQVMGRAEEIFFPDIPYFDLVEKSHD